jgi:GntR family transcriptional regulator
VTIRKALEQLRSEGLVDSRQGYGWFVTPPTVRQSLARLGTIEAQLEAEGRVSQRHIVEFAFVPPPQRVAEVLGAGTVLMVERVNLADGDPFARVTVWCPEDLGEHLSREEVELHSFYDLLPITFGGATQTIGADAASPRDSELLGVPVGSPVLVCRRITSDASGTPVLIGEYVFPSYRTEFIVDLANTEASIAPSGLRLVGDAPA